MALAIFDLDHTLLDGDSDYLWGRFLVENGVVDGEVYERENQRYYDEYSAGTLDIHEYLAFALHPLADFEPEQLYAWRRRFIEEIIRPIMLPKAIELISRHRQALDTLLIITATNRFVTEPIAEAFGVPQMLATEPEIEQGLYTGRPAGTPCFQGGKVLRLKHWLRESGHTLEGSWFYSDSHNDIPLLEHVTHAVAVDPDDILKRHAQQRGWEIITLRR